MKYVQDFLFKISMGDQYFRWKGKKNQWSEKIEENYLNSSTKIELY